MVLNTEWAQVEVIDLVNDGTGLGFGIIGGRSTGVVVKTILPGGVADRDGRLQSGDHILQIGEHNLRGMESVQVAQVLRTAGTQVRLIVARPMETSSPEFQMANSMITRAQIVSTRLLADPEQLDHQLQIMQNGFPEPYTHDLSAEHNDIVNGMMMPEYNGVGSLNQPLGPSPPSSLHLLPDTETAEVELIKDAAGLGVTIAGYVCEREELSGIFIKSVNPGSAADLSGKIAINDQIIEVDGTPLQGYSNHEAVELLKNTGQVVRLKLARYVSGPKYDQLKQAIARTEMASPGGPAAATAAAGAAPPEPPARPSLHGRQPSWSPEGPSLPTSHVPTSHISPEHDRWDSANMQWIDAETSAASGVSPTLETDYNTLPADDYRGPVPPEIEEVIQKQWIGLLGDGYDIVVAQISKFHPGGGLGVSLEGTVDVEDGREVRPRHYIRSILADGPVGLNGRLQSGDELLEVNGRPLVSLNHMEVVSVLKELPTDVRLVCARAWRPPGMDILSSHLEHMAGSDPILGRLGGVPESGGYSSDRLLKAKSDSSLTSSGASVSVTDTSQSRLRSRSLEPLSGLAMWAAEPTIVTLEKGERGLGFSILDYQDPMNPNDTVIVIRSLVPGGAAQLDGRLIPGDRLMAVNAVHLENASLDEAVQALKGAPAGPVRLAVAKPLPLAADSGGSQGLTSSEESESEEESEEEESSDSDGSQHRHLADTQLDSQLPLGCRERLLHSNTSLATSPSPPPSRRRSKKGGASAGFRGRRYSGAANRQQEETTLDETVSSPVEPVEMKDEAVSAESIDYGGSLESGETLEIHLPEAPAPVPESPRIPGENSSEKTECPSTSPAEPDDERVRHTKPEARPSAPTTESTATQTFVTGRMPSGVTMDATCATSREEVERQLLERQQQRLSSDRSSSTSSYSSSYSASGSSSRHSSDITSSNVSSTREQNQVPAQDGVTSVTYDDSDRNSNVANAVDGSSRLNESSDCMNTTGDLLGEVEVHENCGEVTEESDKHVEMAPQSTGDDTGPGSGQTEQQQPHSSVPRDPPDGQQSLPESEIKEVPVSSLPLAQ
ncbi:patj homolog isoform X2 [Amphibalanus amphitrite]|nr:patj homolog isoform X2 [Amphibalanus amphitrite]